MDSILATGLGLIAMFSPIIVLAFYELLTPNLFLLADYEKIRANKEVDLGLAPGSLPAVTIDDVPEERNWRQRNLLVLLGLYGFIYGSFLLSSLPGIPLAIVLKLMAAFGLIPAVLMSFFKGPWTGDFPVRFTGIVVGFLPGIALVWYGGNGIGAGVALLLICISASIDGQKCRLQRSARLAKMQ